MEEPKAPEHEMNSEREQEFEAIKEENGGKRKKKNKKKKNSVPIEAVPISTTIDEQTKIGHN